MHICFLLSFQLGIPSPLSMLSVLILGCYCSFLNILYTSTEGNLIISEPYVSLWNHYVSAFQVQTSCDTHEIFIMFVTKLLHCEEQSAIYRMEGKDSANT